MRRTDQTQDDLTPGVPLEMLERMQKMKHGTTTCCRRDCRTRRLGPDGIRDCHKLSPFQPPSTLLIICRNPELTTRPVSCVCLLREQAEVLDIGVDIAKSNNWPGMFYPTYIHTTYTNIYYKNYRHNLFIPKIAQSNLTLNYCIATLLGYINPTFRIGNHTHKPQRIS